MKNNNTIHYLSRIGNAIVTPCGHYESYGHVTFTTENLKDVTCKKCLHSLTYRRDARLSTKPQ
jgi:hypothetical protein